MGALFLSLPNIELTGPPPSAWDRPKRGGGSGRTAVRPSFALIFVNITGHTFVTASSSFLIEYIVMRTLALTLHNL
jgi:hypothetical protein